MPMMFVLASLGAVVRSRERKGISLLGAFAIIYIAPYIIVAYYFRYFQPIVPIYVLFAYAGLEAASAAAVSAARRLRTIGSLRRRATS
jgi:hypothetical protein